MEKPNRLYRQNLLTQLESYRLILQEKSELLEADRLLREQILLKMWMIESQVNDMTMWEKMEDQTKSSSALQEADRIMAALKNLFAEILGDDNFNPDSGMPSLNQQYLRL